MKISVDDRRKYFKRYWKSILLKLPERASWVVINVKKKSFWDGNCGELINGEIGKWLLKNNFAPWVLNSPPKFKLLKLKGRKFIVASKD